MVERSEQIVLDYLFSSDQGEIVQRNGRDTNRLKIGDKDLSICKRSGTHGQVETETQEHQTNHQDTRNTN